MPSAKDDADIASEQEQRFRDEALWKAQAFKRLQKRGRCYHCSEPTPDTFCDMDCRRDYEREQAVRQRQQAQQRNNKEHGT